MTSRGTVLVLGAYGLAGRAIVAGLLERTDLAVIATGRDGAKLSALAARLDATRVTTRVLDAADPEALRDACTPAGLVVNAVGPYAKSGAEIARTVVETATAYVDCANEQSHYLRLRELDPLARKQGVPLLSAAGVIPGISSLLAMLAPARIEAVESLEIFLAQGRMPGPDVGLGSLLSAVLECGLGPRTLRGGTLVRARLGSDRLAEPMPPPFGNTAMLGFPTIDALTLPGRLPLRSLDSYVAVAAPPPGYFSLVRLLKPHRWQWSYALFARLTRWIARQEYQHALARDLGAQVVMKLVARGPGRCWTVIVRFPDGGTATAYLPVMAARRFFRGELDLTGLLTPIDVFDFEELIGELDALGWPLLLREHVDTD